jgi:hypothetical protein
MKNNKYYFLHKKSYCVNLKVPICGNRLIISKLVKLKKRKKTNSKRETHKYKHTIEKSMNQ